MTLAWTQSRRRIQWRLRTTITAGALLGLAFACDKQPEIEPEQTASGATGGVSASGGAGGSGAAIAAGGGGGSGGESASGGSRASGGTTASGGSAGTAGLLDASPSDLACPTGLPGPALVRIQTTDNVVYCMDQREVTWREYRAFLTAKAGDAAGQPAECSWNTSYDPEYEEPDCDTCDPFEFKCPAGSQPTSEDTAANCLDFCDALAYCEWTGKRLCGRIGGIAKWGRVDIGAGANATSAEREALLDTASSPAMEFGYACTQGGKTLYPYGDTYEPGKCIDAAWIAAKGTSSTDVADLSTRTCHGTKPPFAQIFDLSGSVEERQNLCGLTPLSPELGCFTIGGSSTEYDSDLQACGAKVGFGQAKRKDPTIGFRCCADGVLLSASSP